jgi:hypothetical protein
MVKATEPLGVTQMLAESPVQVHPNQDRAGTWRLNRRRMHVSRAGC